MVHHSARLLLITLTLLLPVALVNDLLAADPGIPVPPQRLTYQVEFGGPVLHWWQASNATNVVLINECAGDAGGTRHELIAAEEGRPGWHARPILVEAGLRSCIRLNEFYEGDALGSYGPYPLAPWLQLLPKYRGKPHHGTTTTQRSGPHQRADHRRGRRGHPPRRL